MLRRLHYTPFIALMFAVLLVCMQIYALNVSTAHIFHEMPPMCELCDLAKQSGSAPPVSHQSAFPSFEHYDTSQYTSSHLTSYAEYRYQSRAPPRLFI